MNNKLLKRIFCFLSIFITLVSMVYNFNLMLYAHATLSHLCMTLSFVLVWVLLALVSWRSLRLRRYILTYWSFVFVSAGICLWNILCDGASGLAIILAMLFGPPWMGLTFFRWKEAIVLSIMMVIAAAFVVYSIIALRRAPKSEAGCRQSASD